MSSLSTLPKGDSAWLLRKSIQRIMQQVSVLETNIGSSTTGNSANTQVIFNDNGTLRGDTGLTFNKTTDLLTVGAATITGDLTVDTNTLKVDSANNVVGIQNATPEAHALINSALVIGNGTAARGLMFYGTSSSQQNVAFSDTASTQQGLLQYDHSVDQMKFFTSGTLQATLNSTGLGVGVSPAAGDGSGAFKAAGTGSLTANSRVGLDVRELVSGNQAGIILGAMTTENTAVIGSRTGSGNIAFQTYNGSWGERMRIDYTGNVGIGVTPSAWTLKSLQIVAGGIYGSGNETGYYANAFYGSSGWRYINAAGASGYLQNGGSHQWYRSTSANVAGTDPVFSQAMTLDASGNLLVGTTTMPSGVTFARLVAKSTSGDWSGVIWNSNATPYGFRIQHDTDSNGTGNEFLYCLGGANLRASIRSNGGIANYQANDVSLSDSRLKTDIKPLASYWNKIKSLELVTFKYKDQTHSDDNIGLIAQQVESVAPELVDVDGFGTTPEDGVPLKTIYTTDLYHAAIKALQEAMTRIEALESKLA